ncbi:cysteine desulfurase family protein [Sphingomonas sp. Leaf205]|uniref:cysteine desulfurase family protein n=1 Tax=Sphingomonas sp. Leaf205 TaxID=2876551 RepID=UPI001E513462|nr:cysteine desulfurase family protein [Sphingomonas sp. Leaf205]
MPIYLDHQASTPLSPSVFAAMTPHFTDGYGNPHSDDHAAGWAASAAIDAARAVIADVISVEPSELTFTSGATEANNLALLGVAEACRGPARIIVTSIEHKSVLAPARALGRRGFDVVVLSVESDGLLDLEVLAAALDVPTALVSVGAVNNEIGVVQPMAEIASLCRDRGALIHTDATQALSWGGADPSGWGVDFASLSSHKAGGPKGIGALYVSLHARHRIEAVQYGGEQEDGLRPGTLPTPLCVGFAEACRTIPDAASVERWRGITEALLSGLQDIWPNLRLNGSRTARHPGNLNVMLPGVEADQLLAMLQPELAISRGSACTSGTPEPSHVLTAIGASRTAADASLRFSTGAVTTMDEVAEALRLLRAAMAGN